MSRIQDAILGRLGYTKKSAEETDRSMMRPVFEGENQNRYSHFVTGESEIDRATRVARYSTWVMSNVEIIGKAQVPADLRVFEEQGELLNPVNNHDFERVFRRPNRFMSSAFLRRYTSNWFMLRGEAFWMLVPDKLGRLVEIWPLPADKVIPIADDKDYIAGYMYKPDGSSKPTVLPAHNICYFRDPNIFDYHRGWSRLLAAFGVINTDNKMQKWNLDTFDNEAVLRTLFSVSSNLQPRIFEQIKSEIIAEIQAGKRYMVARGGDVSVKSIGLTQQEMEYLEGRQFNAVEIDRVFGVNEGIWTANATEASAKVSYELFLNNTIWPLMVMFAQEITTQILANWYSQDGEAFYVAQFDDIRPTNLELEQMEKEQNWQSMTINEIRLSQGLEPFENAYGDLPYPLREHEETIPLLLPQLHRETLMGQLEARRRVDEATEANIVGETEAFDFKAVADEKEMKADKRRWASIAKREFRREGKVSYDFNSAVIPPEDLGLIKHALGFVSDEGQLKHVFSEHFLEDVKAVNLGDLPSDISAEIFAFQGQMDALVNQAIRGQITQADFESRLASLVDGMFITMFDLGSNGADNTDVIELESALQAARLSVASYANDIYSGRYESVEQTRTRTILWIVLATGVWNGGRLYDESVAAYMWRRGGTSEPCGTCVGLDGTVMTRQEWQANPYRPQGRNLDCGGWNCLCHFVPSSLPSSHSGNLPIT